MKFIKYLAILVIVAVVIGAVALKTLTRYVDVGQVGVRTQEYSIFGKKGLVEADYAPGWHRDFGPIDSWKIFDATVQTLEMSRDPSRGDRRSRDDVRVQSSDGYMVSVDVTVKFRIQPGKAYKVYELFGGGTSYRTIVRNEAENACVEMFGQMKTEEFYDPLVRREKSEKVRAALQGALSNKFIEVIDVLVRDVQFDVEYENKIRQKKLSDQEVELNKSLSKAEQMSGKTQVIVAETSRLVNIITKEKEAELIRMQAEANREVVTIRAEAERYATEKQADADVIAAHKKAQGSLLVKEAEAKGETLRNEAMRGVGGSTIVALEAARNLNLKDVSISTIDNDLLNLDEMATKLGVPEESE